MPEKFHPREGEAEQSVEGEEQLSETEQGKQKPSSRVARMAGSLAAAGLVVGGMAAGAEAAPQGEHHVRSNAEQGETVGFAVVPQNEQELADQIAQLDKGPQGPSRQVAALTYEALYAAHNNDAAGLERILKQYYTLLAKNPDVAAGIMQEAGEDSITVLLRHGHIDTALAVVKHISNKKVHDHLLHQIQAAHIHEQEEKRKQ